MLQEIMMDPGLHQNMIKTVFFACQQKLLNI
jgi:hypothetical protein